MVATDLCLIFSAFEVVNPRDLDGFQDLIAVAETRKKSNKIVLKSYRHPR